jgi:hypothetical protein
MPIDAIRSVSAHLDILIRSVHPQRLIHEMNVGDKAFYFRHFKGFRPEKVGRGRIRKIAEQEILNKEPGHELFANLIIVHWNEQNGTLYQDMVSHIKTINEDVEAIEAIEDDKATQIIDDLIARHAKEDVYLCVRLNEVRFSDAIIESRLAGRDA